MFIRRSGYVIITGICLLYLSITFFMMSIPGINLLGWSVRLFALYGYLSLGIAAIMTPFMKEITRSFGRSFISIHHIFAITGLILVTLHPIMFSLQRLDLGVFIPRFDSWVIFWELAGRPALYILYIAAVAGLYRKRGMRYWRIIHALTYIALFFGIIHANLIGTDFMLSQAEPSNTMIFLSNVGVTLIFNGVFATIMLAFIFKRYRLLKLKKGRQ